MSNKEEVLPGMALDEVLMENKELPRFTEFEVKFKVDISGVHDFKKIVESLPNLKRFEYIQGSDFYYVHKDGSFMRYRKADYDKSSRAELTIKQKREEKTNVNRMEVNLRVDYSDKETVEKFASVLDYEFNFSIWKSAHIYDFSDGSLVFYSVRDMNGSMTDFIEIEVNPELKVTEEEAWEIIKKYESTLAPLGIIPQKRLKKSLFEMYKKEVKS